MPLPSGSKLRSGENTWAKAAGIGQPRARRLSPAVSPMNSIASSRPKDSSAAAIGCAVRLDEYRLTAAKLAVSSSSASVSVASSPMSRLVLPARVSGMASTSRMISSRKAISPMNLPMMISVIEIGADSSRVMVWLRRSSAIMRIASSGTANSSTAAAVA